MTKLKPTRFGLWAGAAFLALVLPLHAAAQQTLDTNQTINVPSKKKAPTKAKFYGQVVFVNPQEIQVRDNQNYMHLRIFTYTPQVSAKMAKIHSRGGYKYGDHVEVVYKPGSDVALDIKGRPSNAG